MKIYFCYQEDTGEFSGFYNDVIYKTIPEPNVEITKELWDILYTGNWKVDITKIKNVNQLTIENKDEYLIKEKDRELIDSQEIK